jgi:hypothetical protein
LRHEAIGGGRRVRQERKKEKGGPLTEQPRHDVSESCNLQPQTTSTLAHLTIFNHALLSTWRPCGRMPRFSATCRLLNYEQNRHIHEKIAQRPTTRSQTCLRGWRCLESPEPSWRHPCQVLEYYQLFCFSRLCQSILLCGHAPCAP